VTPEEEEKYSILSKEQAEQVKEVTNDDLKEMGLDEQQLVELKTAFDAIDIDGNGGITFEELVQYSKASNSGSTEEELKAWMDTADVNGDGEINF